MKTVTVQARETRDGKLFLTEAEALKHEEHLALVDRIAVIVAPLGVMVTDCSYANGHGYVQRDGAVARSCLAAILQLACELCDARNLRFLVDLPADELWKYRHGIAGRIIDECCPRPVYGAWYRLGCIDDKFREWGQMYFALNPTKGDQVEWPEVRKPTEEKR